MKILKVTKGQAANSRKTTNINQIKLKRKQHIVIYGECRSLSFNNRGSKVKILYLITKILNHNKQLKNYSGITL